MSNLASKITSTPAPSSETRRGPANACFPKYGPGDLEDFNAVEELRARGLTWREVQAHVDQLAGVDPLPLEKFRYHWRRFCFCWPEDLRR